MVRRLTLALAALALFDGGAGCNPPLQITLPAAGVPVTTFSFAVEVQVTGANLDPSTLEATLNGDPVVLAEGPPGVFTTTVNPGDPLQDANLLEVTVKNTNGSATYLATRPFDYLPPKARARQITNPADLIAGPLAHGQLGDFLLENDVARFVVQRENLRDLHSVGQYGGNLIDAELLASPGDENFFEIAPSVNIETVINATSVEVLNDGQNGLPAVVEACGPDDLIDYINASSQVAQFGATFPPGVDDQDYDVTGCTQYVLEPETNLVQMDTTITSSEGSDLDLFVGDYVNGMGELEQWSPLATGAVNFQLGLGEMLALPSIAHFSLFGYGQAEGRSYFRVGRQLSGSSNPDSSFTVSGVSFVLSSLSIPGVLFFGSTPVFTVPAGGSNTFTRFFGVGDGDGQDAAATDLAERSPPVTGGTLEGCVTLGAGLTPAPGARVAATFQTVGGQPTLGASFVTDASGCYAGTLAPGNYAVSAARQGTPYEGGGAAPATHPVSITSGNTTVQDVNLPDTGHVDVSVVDQAGSPVPARVSVVGFDPSPEPILTFNFLGLIVEDGGQFNDISRDRFPFGIAQAQYADAGGTASFDLEPGSYQVFVSRGSEWSVFSEPLTVSAGATETVNAQIAHVIDTPGFISSDFHVHMIFSPDSRVSQVDRVMQFAGEGVDNIIATDHDARTDLNPTIASLGLTSFVHATIGEEVTTFDTGHYNAYPLGQDPARPSLGSTDWAREAAGGPGTDFPSNGEYIRTPSEIHAEVLGQLDSGGQPLNTSPNVAMQINHIDSHFSPLKIDTAQQPPQSFLGPGEPEVFRLDPSVGNFFHAFPALELWNGDNRAHQSEFLDDRIGIWMNLLNQGIATTFIADTDTHDFISLRAAGARTWTPSSTDAPAGIDVDEVGAAVLDGKGVGGQGVYVQASLREADLPANQADFSLGGSTTLDTAGDPEVELVIDVQAPTWAPYDTIEIYRNAQTVVTGSNGGTPVLYSATPSMTLTAGVDFSVSTVNVHGGVPGADRLETSLVVPQTLAEDSWFVVVVRGSDGVSEPMFPVFAQSLSQGSNGTLADLLDGNLGENGVLALGATNALYADVDGNPGFDAPGVNVAP